MLNEEIARTFTYEQRETALIFIRDFERSGIHLPPEARSTFVTLSDQLNVLSRAFSTPTQKKPIFVRSADLNGIPPRIRKHMTQQATFTGKMRIYPGSWEALMISKYSPNEELRRSLYVADMLPEPAKVETLEELLKARDQLARLVGKASFAEWSLDNKMAKSSGTH